jgi:hypothetical protein
MLGVASVLFGPGRGFNFLHAIIILQSVTPPLHEDNITISLYACQEVAQGTELGGTGSSQDDSDLEDRFATFAFLISTHISPA